MYLNDHWCSTQRSQAFILHHNHDHDSQHSHLHTHHRHHPKASNTTPSVASSRASTRISQPDTLNERNTLNLTTKPSSDTRGFCTKSGLVSHCPLSAWAFILVGATSFTHDPSLIHAHLSRSTPILGACSLLYLHYLHPYYWCLDLCFGEGPVRPLCVRAVLGRGVHYEHQ